MLTKTITNSKTQVFKPIILLALVLAIWILPTASSHALGLTIIQQRVLLIFIFAVIMWVTEYIPAWITSVSVTTLSLLTVSDSALNIFKASLEGEELLSSKALIATFADPIIFLFIGGFILAAVASKFQIDRKIANGVIGLIGTQSRYYLLGIMSVTGLCSMFISNTATAIMMLTMITPMLKQMSDTDKGRTALVLGVSVAANVGGIGTPIGTPPNAIVLKYLNDPAGMNLGIGFGDWMLVFVPFSIILIGISWLIISKLYPFSNPEMEKVDTMQVEEKGKCDLLMKYAVYCIFGTTIALWCFDSFFGVNPNVVAFVPICLFALLGVVGKKELAEIDWSVLWLISGGFALGLAFQESGLAHTLISGIDFSSIQPWVIIFSCWMVCWGLANVISHTAAVTLVTPIFVVLAMSLSQELAIFGGARTLLIGIAVFASLAMILPISTPPNALVYSTGFVQKKDLQTVGIIIGMIGLGLSSLLVFFIR